MAYIQVAEELAARIFRFSVRLPKRYTFYLASPLFDHAESVVYHCRAANQTYVDTRERFELRRNHLLEAGNHLLHVETLLGILHEVTVQNSDRGDGKPPNDNVYAQFAEMIEREQKLLQGVKVRDTKTARDKGIIAAKQGATE